MLLAENVPVLQCTFPKVWAALQEIEENPAGLERVEVVNPLAQQPSLLYHRDNKAVLLHSRYNPMQESERLYAQYSNLEAYQHVFFYGVGLGYAIDYLIGHYPGKTFTLFEPDPAVLYRFLERNSLADLQAAGLTGIVCGSDAQQIILYLYEYIRQLDRELLLIALPSYQQVFADHYRFFCQALQEIVSYRKLFLQANHLYEQKWVMNSIQNFRLLLETPNFLLQAGRFKGKPVIIVGAGPSLNEELDNLRHIKQNGLAPIFAAGSGIVPLVNAGISPDFACSYDPNNVGKVVYEHLPDVVLASIPLLFGSCVGPEVVQNYPGPKTHFITAQDRIAPYYLGLAGGESIPIASDGMTISFVLMHLLQRMGANPIVLVGQNLAYRNNQPYAQGIGYYPSNLNQRLLQNTVTVEDVNGEPVLTTRDFQAMLQDMERLVALHPDTVFINTTQGGAKIRGTRFQSLKTLLETVLTVSENEGEIFVNQNSPYDSGLLSERVQALEEAYGEFEGIGRELKVYLETLAPSRLKPGAGNEVLPELSAWLQKIAANRFYQTYLSAMHTLEVSFLNTALTQIENQVAGEDKVQARLKVIQAFLEKVLADFTMIRPLYRSLHDGICKGSLQMQ